MNRRGNVIVDLQFGSCGKGLLAGYCATKRGPDTVVCAWGPNSGHTYIDQQGRKFVHIMVPNGVVSPNLRQVLIGPGAVINPELMATEIENLREMGVLHDRVRIGIHTHAAVVNEGDRMAESQSLLRIGSTMKGTAEANIRKIRRQVEAIAHDALIRTPLEGYLVEPSEYNSMLDHADKIQIEGCQGFSLSINHGFYPYTTSRDCTVLQTLSDCAIPADWLPDLNVIGACRTYPIRVSNRGEFTSGPGYFDQKEIEWSDLGIEPELTTVTRLPRRVFTWSWEQINQAIRMNAPDEIFLNFANYMENWRVRDLARQIDHRLHTPVTLIGTGPKHSDIRTWQEFRSL